VANRLMGSIALRPLARETTSIALSQQERDPRKRIPVSRRITLSLHAAPSAGYGKQCVNATARPALS
jgi:hypothetical protein